MRYFFIISQLFILLSSSLSLKAQTPVVLCPDVSSFTSMTRGYYFTAPTTFTICGIYVEDDRSTSAQSVEIIRFTAGAPPLWTATTNSFVSLFYQNNFVPNTMIPVPNITINAGEIIGVYGSRATVNSYGTGPCNTTIQGFPVTLYRSGMQFDLATQQMHDVWTENSYIGRVTIYTDCCPPPSAISAITGPTSVCEGNTVTYTVPAQTGATAYNWTVPAGATITGGQNTTSLSVTWNSAPGGQVCITWTDACSTSPQTCLNVTVNPTPTVTVPLSASYCNGDAISASTFTSNPVGGTFTWTNSNTLIGLGASGIGNTPAFSATNTTGAPISSTITVTPTVNGCLGTASIYTITVNPTPTVTLPTNASYCDGDAVPAGTFTSNPAGGTFSWINSNTAIGLGPSGVGNTPAFTALNSTSSPITSTISVTTSVNSCLSIAVDYTITVNSTPVADAPVNVSACNSYTLPNLTVGNYYTGSGGTGTAVFAGDIITTSQTIYVYAESGTIPNCTDENSFIVTINQNPTPSITGILSFCSGNNTTLDAGAYSSYSWLPSGNSQTLVVTTGGNYAVTVTDANGCTGSDSTAVIEYPNPVPSITGTLSFCSGFSTTIDAGNGYLNYNWLPSGSSQTLIVTSGGNYAVTVTDVNGCTGSDNVNIIENSSLTPTITGTLSLCTGNNTILDAGAGYTTYIWSPSGSTQTINVTTGGNYAVTVTDSNGCTGIDNATVIENPNPSPNITGTLSFCTGYSTNLDAGIYSAWLWSTTDVTQTINITSGGSFSVTVTDVNGCTGSDNTTVIENSSSVPNITGVLSFCSGNSTMLSANNGYNSYIWSTSGNNQSITVTSGGIYSVTVTDANGCTASNNVTVIEIPQPDINDITDQTACDSYNLPTITGANLTGSQNFYSAANGGGSLLNGQITSSQTIYMYDETGTSPNCIDEESFQVTINLSSTTFENVLMCNGDSIFIGNGWQTNAGTYYDNLLSVAGCDSVIVTNLTTGGTIDVSITPVDTLCENSASVYCTSIVSGGIWTGTGITNSSNGLFNPAVAGPGTHQIIYTLSSACYSADTIYIVVDSIPRAGVIGDNSIMYGGNSSLAASGGGTYLWLDAEGISCNYCQYIEVSPSESAYYCVVVTNYNGCKDTACIKILVNLDCGELFIPNAFSPNGDNYNDILYVRGKCIKTMHLSIFDRWGKLVFESDDQNIGWDGSYKGRNLDDAVFLYYLQVTFLNLETEELKGNISLIR